MKSTDNKEFEYFQVEDFFLPQSFFEKSEIGHLQLYWPCLGSSQFETNTGRAFGPSRLV